MREIKYIVLHCTATPLNTTVHSIQNYWRNHLGWRNPGYHYLIEKDGKVHNLQPIEKPSNGVAGYNANSVHLATIGGQLLDDRTLAQKHVMHDLVRQLKKRFPDAEILGHRDFPNVAKACPRYNAKEWFENHLK